LRPDAIAGTEPGQRRLNGPQTTGRHFQHLSRPQFRITTELDQRVDCASGVTLLADVLRPDTDGAVPALVAASPYPRQIQNSGAPLGFVEAGASDFWVPRGYAHVIANVRGTGGSTGTYGFLDEGERRDLFDLIEWTAVQPWCNGQVGMIGISYFAMAQLAAAIERPPHLQALFCLATTADPFELISHNGAVNSTFVGNWLQALGVVNSRDPRTFRSAGLGIAETLLKSPGLHSRFAHFNGESAMKLLSQVGRVPYEAVPWDELYEQLLIEHPHRDAFWDERDSLSRLDRVQVPTYLGCDWENVSVHLPSTFTTWHALKDRVPTRMGVLGKDGLTWPWESLHVEALAWFDHWLKGIDTGIMDGPPVRYWLPGADEWQACEDWPPPGTGFEALALRTDGTLGTDEGTPGERSYLCVPPALRRPHAHPPTLPASLTWDTVPFPDDLDIAGPIELQLHASTSATDTAWMVTLQVIAADGEVTDLTAGWLRAAFRDVDDEASSPGSPMLPCRRAEVIPPGEPVAYRIPVVPTARRVMRGERIRLILASDDRTDGPARFGLSHSPPSHAALNRVLSGSRLLLPSSAPVAAASQGSI
jgi:putative CocE/NonD family hydrolase